MIELLVVMAIVAIMSLMAAPSYMDRLVRQQIVEALPLADIVKTPIADAWSVKPHKIPANNAEAFLPVPEKIVNNYIRSIQVDNGAIHITFGNSAHGAITDKILTLRPAVVEDAPIVPVTWICGHGPVPGNMTVKGPNKTNIEPMYLPINCRSRK